MAFRSTKKGNEADTGGIEVVHTEDGKLAMLGGQAPFELTVAEAIGPEVPRPMQIEVLHEVVGLSLREIAFAASVTEQSVRNWKKQGKPNKSAAYDDLRAVVERIYLACPAEPKLIGAWLRSRNRGLSYKRPLEMLQAGEFEMVMDVAESFIALSPPADPGPERAKAASEKAAQRSTDPLQPEPTDLERRSEPDRTLAPDELHARTAL